MRHNIQLIKEISCESGTKYPHFFYNIIWRRCYVAPYWKIKINFSGNYLDLAHNANFSCVDWYQIITRFSFSTYSSDTLHNTSHFGNFREMQKDRSIQHHPMFLYGI